MSDRRVKIIDLGPPQMTRAPALPSLINTSVIVLLMPTLLFAINIPSLVNVTLATLLAAAVVLDRLSLRRDARQHWAAEQKVVQEILKQMSPPQGDTESSSRTPGDVPKNKDGETLQ